MNKKIFNLLTLTILLSGLVIRLLPLRNNNFYFTMDQGNDAIKVSGITTYHHLPLLGPETSIFGLYAGPLWFYFSAIGYFLFAGHPVGPVILLILLNALLTFLIIKKISQEISPKVGLIIGFALQTSWLYYDSSRYAFNPFPNVFLCFIAIFLLCDFLGGKQIKYVLAGIPISLFIHTDIASSVPIILVYLSVGFYALIYKRISPRYFFYGLFILFLSVVPHIISEFQTDFSQFRVLLKEINNPRGSFAHSQPSKLSYHIFLLTARSIFRQIPELGFLGFAILLLLFFSHIYSKNIHQFTKRFVIISLCIMSVSWIFFSSNSGWRDWQTSYLSPIIFSSVLLILLDYPSVLSIPILTISFFSHLQLFSSSYLQYLNPSGDPSLLTNELKAIDYVYKDNQNNKFSVYVWIPSIFDHNYQYLFRWYGKNKYNDFPCEVNTYPKSPQTYLPNWYAPESQPNYRCQPTYRYLIMEPDKNNSIDQTWYLNITKNTTLIEETKVGKILLEKRLFDKN